MSLHLILGPMFSGKSTRLIEHIRAFKTLGFPILVVKPAIDSRYGSDGAIHTHNSESEPCMLLPVDGLAGLAQTAEFAAARVVMVEEGQFFTGLRAAVQHWMDRCGKHCYVTALNGDYRRELFGEVHQLLPLCHELEWLQALCIECRDGTPAVYSKRVATPRADAGANAGAVAGADAQVLVAAADRYAAVCLRHYA